MGWAQGLSIGKYIHAWKRLATRGQGHSRRQAGKTENQGVLFHDGAFSNFRLKADEGPAESRGRGANARHADPGAALHCGPVAHLHGTSEFYFASTRVNGDVLLEVA